MKIADSADDQTRLAKPGLDRMMAWAGVGEKTVISVVTQLVGLDLVERKEIGQSGRRATYKIFPHGVPHIPSTEELLERRLAARRAPKNARLARHAKSPRRKPAAAARTIGDVVARVEARQPSTDAADARLPQGNPEGAEARVAPGEPSGFPPGDPVGSPSETPSLPPPSSPLPFPPPPATGPTGERLEGHADEPASGCPKHARPAGNCRACGTNPRALREQQQHKTEQLARDAQRRWLDAFLSEQARRVADSDPTAVEEARREAYEQARSGRERGPNVHGWRGS
ncbi:hypothetical protein ACFIN9_26610 [Streptomyces noursei]